MDLAGVRRGGAARREEEDGAPAAPPRRRAGQHALKPLLKIKGPLLKPLLKILEVLEEAHLGRVVVEITQHEHLLPLPRHHLLGTRVDTAGENKGP